jgi:hypothetical protein
MPEPGQFGDLCAAMIQGEVRPDGQALRLLSE